MILTILGGLLGFYVFFGLLGTAFYHLFLSKEDYSGDAAGVLLVAWGWPMVIYYAVKHAVVERLAGP